MIQRTLDQKLPHRGVLRQDRVCGAQWAREVAGPAPPRSGREMAGAIGAAARGPGTSRRENTGGPAPTVPRRCEVTGGAAFVARRPAANAGSDRLRARQRAAATRGVDLPHRPHDPRSRHRAAGDTGWADRAASGVVEASSVLRSEPRLRTGKLSLAKHLPAR